MDSHPLKQQIRVIKKQNSSVVIVGTVPVSSVAFLKENRRHLLNRAHQKKLK